MMRQLASPDISVKQRKALSLPTEEVLAELGGGYFYMNTGFGNVAQSRCSQTWQTAASCTLRRPPDEEIGGVEEQDWLELTSLCSAQLRWQEVGSLMQLVLTLRKAK